MPESNESLAFVTTDELLEELKNRCEQFYLLMVPTETSVADWSTCIFGNIYTLFGLVEASKQVLLSPEAYKLKNMSGEDTETDEDE